MFDKGLASNRAQKVMDTFGLNKRMESDVLTASDIIKWTGEKEAVIKLLQMQTYFIEFPLTKEKGKALQLAY